MTQGLQKDHQTQYDLRAGSKKWWGAIVPCDEGVNGRLGSKGLNDNGCHEIYIWAGRREGSLGNMFKIHPHPQFKKSTYRVVLKLIQAD